MPHTIQTRPLLAALAFATLAMPAVAQTPAPSIVG
jgi:hypothetical protein